MPSQENKIDFVMRYVLRYIKSLTFKYIYSNKIDFVMRHMYENYSKIILIFPIMIRYDEGFISVLNQNSR